MKFDPLLITYRIEPHNGHGPRFFRAEHWPEGMEPVRCYAVINEDTKLIWFYEETLPRMIIDMEREFNRPKPMDYRDKVDNMKLSVKQRKKLSTSKFALPKERKYPIEDKAHAANAKARASQMQAKGKLSSSQKAKIDSKANKVLGKGKKKVAPKAPKD